MLELKTRQVRAVNIKYASYSCRTTGVRAISVVRPFVNSPTAVYISFLRPLFYAVLWSLPSSVASVFIKIY